MEMKQEKLKNDKKSMLKLEDRKKLFINGVLEVINFNEQEINLTTQLGQLKIEGSNLKMNKLDVQNGDIVVIGTIDSCVYSSNNKKNNENILAKLFR